MACPGRPASRAAFARANERETSWAPPHVGEGLRLARLQARTALENAIREDHEVRAAAHPESEQRHRRLAEMWRAMEAKATDVASLLAEAQDTRRQWEALTEPTRRVAVAADLELRRRHPKHALEPLRSAEPASTLVGEPDPGVRSRGEVWVQPTLDGTVHLPEAQPEADPAGREALPSTQAQREAVGQQVLGLTPESVHEEISEQVVRIREISRQAQATIDDFASTREPAEEAEATEPGPAWNVQARRQRDAILQPPKPDIVPAREVLERAPDRQAGMEAELG